MCNLKLIMHDDSSVKRLLLKTFATYCTTNQTDHDGDLLLF